MMRSTTYAMNTLTLSCPKDTIWVELWEKQPSLIASTIPPVVGSTVTMDLSWRAHGLYPSDHIAEHLDFLKYMTTKQNRQQQQQRLDSRKQSFSPLRFETMQEGSTSNLSEIMRNRQCLSGSAHVVLETLMQVVY